MDEFLKWMKEKGHLHYLDSDYGKFPYIECDCLKMPIGMIIRTIPNQMLIGYMIEYLREIKGKLIMNIGGRASIEDLYNDYVKQIEEIPAKP